MVKWKSLGPAKGWLGAIVWGLTLACSDGAGQEPTPSSDGDAGSSASESTGPCPSLSPPEAGDVVATDLIITTVDDAASALAISEVGGSLLISRTFPGVLHLPNLRRVGGDVRLQGDQVMIPPESWSAMTELRLPHLESIGGELFLYLTGALVETDLRSLKTVGKRVYYMRNVALRRIGLDSIANGSVSIQASPLSAACEIDAICKRIGATDCGAEYSDASCSCVEQCGRLEPHCD